jgi:hypothetical protein
VSGFTATFGPLRAAPRAGGRDADGDAEMAAAPGSSGGNGARAGGGAYRPIIDAPSHALPSLLAMLPAYMEALLRETEPPSA